MPKSSQVFFKMSNISILIKNLISNIINNLINTTKDISIIVNNDGSIAHILDIKLMLRCIRN